MKLIKWREDLHQIPELGLHETKTTKYLINELEKMGYTPKPLPNLETGCYIYIDKGSTQTIAYRTDIDALEIGEANLTNYISKHVGYMHACGHDGHMSAMLGFCDEIKDLDFHVNVLIIFQPAEESPGAAKIICESGLLEYYHVSEIYGIHLMPQYEEGKLITKPGPLMAECAEIDIVIHGKGSHAGLPEEGIDSILIASSILNQFQTIVSRQTSPFEPIVLNIGSIQGGSARNAVAQECEMHGTLRGYNETLFLETIHKMKQVIEGMKLIYQIEIDFKCDPMYPPLINDKKLYEQLIQIENIETLERPLMLAEDFAYYGQKIPSLFIYLGTKTKKFTSGLHTATFDFNPEVLQKAVAMYKKILLLKK